MSFFSELKRRNVFRVALLYMVACWLVMQVADVGVSLLGLPGWTGRFVFLLLVIGFPLVMVFSWAYEITPEGLKKEKEVSRDISVTHETAKKLDTAVIVLLVVGIGGLILDRFLPEQAAVMETVADEPAATQSASERSIAVLPFVNMSADDENGYFSDGLSEELLNLLAKIPELQVAARTSSFRFKDSELGIAEIASQLNVAHVLEGSVRKSGDDIRITAQLIKVSDGYHLWSETWDRRLIDVFSIQDEIAAAVVDQLRISLLGEIPKTRVTDPEAYALYLQARQVSNRFTKESLEEAIALLTEALAIDPEYAEAWTELSRAHTNLAGSSNIAPEVGYPRANAAANRALSIDPKNARAMSNLGWNAMYWERDFTKAARLIGQARALEPGNVSIMNAYAVLDAAFDNIESGIAIYEEALTIDPFSMSVAANLTAAYLNVGDLDQAGQMLPVLEEIEPESVWVHYLTGWYEHQRGNLENSLVHFERTGGVYGQIGLAIANYDLGNEDASVAALEKIRDAPHTEVNVASVLAYRGEADAAFEWLERAYEARDAEMVEIRMFRLAFADLHNDPRWNDLVSRIGMTDELASELGL